MSDQVDLGPTARQDLIGGLIAVALAIYVLVEASQYPMGSLLRMGPGFFPCVVGFIILLLGLSLIAASFRKRPKADGAKVRLRPVIAIGFGVMAFALLLERFGLIPATLALVMLSSLAEPNWRWRRTVILAVAMSAFVFLLFVVVLGMPIRALKW